VQTGYDTNARPATQTLVSGSTTYALTQTSYDALGRPECVAQRMNTAVYGALPTSACTLGTAGSFGPDRITKTFRDAAGQATKTTTALGVTGVEADGVAARDTFNGIVQAVTRLAATCSRFARRPGIACSIMALIRCPVWID